MNGAFENTAHRGAAFIGGFTGIYALLIRANFGSSQTLNLLHLVENLVGRDFFEALLHIGGAVIYGGTIFAVTIIEKKTRLDIRYLSMTVNICGFTILGLMPQQLPAAVGLYPIFMMMSVQWIAFSKVDGFASSPIFSTNNLRQLSDALACYVCDRDKKHLKKAKAFAGTLLFFHIGAAAGYFACEKFGIRASFLGILPSLLMIVILLMPTILRLSERRKTA